MLGVILTSLYRESNRLTKSDIKTHAQEVMDLIKSKFGEDEVFNLALVEVQQASLRARDERRDRLKQQLVEDPEAASKRKLNIAAKRKDKRSKKKKLI